MPITRRRTLLLALAATAAAAGAIDAPPASAVCPPGADCIDDEPPPPPPPSDHTAPNTGIDGPVGASSGVFTVTLSSTEGGSTFQCKVGAGPWTGCSSPHTIDPVASGVWTVSARATDAAGNTDATPASHTVVVNDVFGPTTTITDAPIEPWEGAINDPTPTFSFTTSADAIHRTCKVVGLTSWAPCGSPYTTPPLADGFHTVGMRATDPSGNVGNEAGRTVLIDTVKPTTNLADPPASTFDRTPTFAWGSPWDSYGQNHYACKVDGVSQGACGDAAWNDEGEFTTPHLSVGWHTFAVRATDKAGNQQSGWTSHTFQVKRLYLAAG